MKTKSIKREEALKRKEHYAVLSIKQKIDLLDQRFGVGVGAIKQRKRLLEKLTQSK